MGQGSHLISSVVFIVILNDVSPFRVKKKLLLQGNRRALLKLFTHSSCSGTVGYLQLDSMIFGVFSDLNDSVFL